MSSSKSHHPSHLSFDAVSRFFPNTLPLKAHGDGKELKWSKASAKAEAVQLAAAICKRHPVGSVTNSIYRGGGIALMLLKFALFHAKDQPTKATAPSSASAAATASSTSTAAATGGAGGGAGASGGTATPPPSSSSKAYLELCAQHVDAIVSKNATKLARRVTFGEGLAGVVSVGIVAHTLLGNSKRAGQYIKELLSFADECADKHADLPYEWLYGRAGFLYCVVFVNALVPATIDIKLVQPVIAEVLRSGHKHRRSKCPLMYEWHDTKYLGAVHGVAGICHVLMQFPLSAADAEAVRGTMRYLCTAVHPGGNPMSKYKHDDAKADRLVQFCHGAGGVILTMCQAYARFGDKEFLSAAQAMGECLWQRGLLRKGCGLCHGVAGNGYSFLALYRATKDETHLWRAQQFALACTQAGRQLLWPKDTEHSDELFSGLAGAACFILDATDAASSWFPGFELPS